MVQEGALFGVVDPAGGESLTVTLVYHSDLGIQRIKEICIPIQ